MIEIFNKNKFNSKRFKPVLSYVSIEYKRSRELIKEANFYKKSDINHAIELIIKSILLIDEVYLSDYLKLSNYYHIARNDNAYKVLSLLKESFDVDDCAMYFMNLAEVDNYFCITYYSDKDYLNYLFHYCSWLRNTVIAFGSQGRTEDLKRLISNQNKLQYLSSSKLMKSLIESKIDKENFNDNINTYVSNISLKAEIMANIVNNLKNNKNYYNNIITDENSGQRANRILKNDQLFYQSYNFFLNENFRKIYLDEIQVFTI